MIDCGPLTDPANGQVNTSGTTFGSTATYTCDTGYILSGSQSRTCRAFSSPGPTGLWTSRKPLCEGIYTTKIPYCNFVVQYEVKLCAVMNSI